MRSLKKKLLSLAKHGIDPISEGINNFVHQNIDVELLAKERKDICLKCPMYVEEPISFLRIEDKSIPELSNKMCDICGCTLSYKLRQSKDICNKWQV